MKELFRIVAEGMDKIFDRWTSHFGHERLEGKEENNNQHLTNLQYQAQQPRVATEVDVETETKTRKRRECAAPGRVKHGDTSSARVDDGPKSFTGFDETAEPLLAPEKCTDDALVNGGAEAPKPHFLFVEMRILSFADSGLMLAGIASTRMRAVFPQPPLSWSLGRTKFNRLAPLCCRKVMKTTSRQALVFDPGGCSGRLRGCPFLRGWHVLLRGGFVWDAAMVSEAGAFLLSVGLQHHFQKNSKRLGTPYVIALDRYSSEARKTTESGGDTRP